MKWCGIHVKSMWNTREIHMVLMFWVLMKTLPKFSNWLPTPPKIGGVGFRKIMKDYEILQNRVLNILSRIYKIIFSKIRSSLINILIDRSETLFWKITEISCKTINNNILQKPKLAIRVGWKMKRLSTLEEIIYTSVDKRFIE